MTDFHLWIDFESTGLNPQRDAVLEVGWTITDTDLRMLTPLRSRLALINPENVHFDPDHESWNGLNEVVRTMHETSGLRDDLFETWATPRLSHSLLTQPRDFERLLLEDLAAIGFDWASGDKLVVSGAGVSHFDVHLLAQHWPELFPLLPGQGDVATYWQYDTSVAWRVLGKKTSEMVTKWAPKLDDIVHRDPLWSLFTAEAGADPNMSHLVVRVGDSFVFHRDAIRPHRAADDVAASLLDARLLRAIFDILPR